MKSKINFVIISVLVVVNLLIFIFVFFEYEGGKKNMNEMQNEYFYQARRKIIDIETSNESLLFPDIVYKGTDTINPIKLDISKPTLICYFSIQTCAPCYQSMLEQVISIFPDYASRDDIIFFSNDLDFKLRNNFYDKAVYAHRNFHNNLPIEESHASSLFILDKDMKIDMFFIADKQTPGYTKDYLMKIKERFLQ